jgi:hypothetical protein
MDRYSLSTRHIDSPRYTLMNPSRTSHGGVVLFFPTHADLVGCVAWIDSFVFLISLHITTLSFPRVHVLLQIRGLDGLPYVLVLAASG